MGGERDAKENPLGKIGAGVSLIVTQIIFGKIFLRNKQTKEEQTMKNSTRWILFLAGIVVLILCVHYFLVPLWPSYPTTGWGYRHFGPRTFPWVFLLELLIAFIIGFALYKLLFHHPDLNQREKRRMSAPYCGREFQRSESTTGVHSEDLSKEKAQQ